MEHKLSNWRRSFFVKAIFDPGQAEALAAAPGEAVFIQKALETKNGSKILDLCCGTGRHSLQLARRGFLVTGVDATSAYLSEARRLAHGVKNVKFLKGDMRRLGFNEEFDAAINMWTSFGYFLKPEDDLKSLRCVARALKSRGRFLIDIVNGAWLRRHRVEKNWMKRADGSFVLEDIAWRLGKHLCQVSTWTVIKNGRAQGAASFFVRHYEFAQLASALRRAGLKAVCRWGGLDGSPYRPQSSKRLVVLTEKMS